MDDSRRNESTPPGEVLARFHAEIVGDTIALPPGVASLLRGAGVRKVHVLLRNSAAVLEPLRARGIDAATAERIARRQRINPALALAMLSEEGVFHGTATAPHLARLAGIEE